MSIERPALVSGLVWVTEGRPAHHTADAGVLTGPAIGAALGLLHFAQSPQLVVAVPESTNRADRRYINAIDPRGRLLCPKPLPPLVWAAGAIVGDERRWALRGDPRHWGVACHPSELHGRTLVLANGHIGSYAGLLRAGRPRFVAMDINVGWVPSQVLALGQCLRRAHLVTITRSDLERLPRAATSGTGLGEPGGAALLVKAGPAGVTLVAGGHSCMLPPPEVARLQTDVGAGDLLLGCLAALLGHTPVPLSAKHVEHAYAKVRPVLSRLLQSDGFDAFADDLLDLRPVG